MTKNSTRAVAVLTLVGVPAGLALTGGNNVQTVMTATLAAAWPGWSC